MCYSHFTQCITQDYYCDSLKGAIAREYKHLISTLTGAMEVTTDLLIPNDGEVLPQAEFP